MEGPSLSMPEVCRGCFDSWGYAGEWNTAESQAGEARGAAAILCASEGAENTKEMFAALLE